MVDIHYFFGFFFVMAGLKSFLYGAAPILGTTGAALYERQRALVNLKVLAPAPGRGPGSGVPLTPYNVAAVIISVLVTDNLAEVDERVALLINAAPMICGAKQPDGRGNHAAWKKAGSPTFCTAVAAVLAGVWPMPWPMAESRLPVHTIRVTRSWCGALVSDGADPTEYIVQSGFGRYFSPVQVTAEIRAATFFSLRDFTLGALSQAAAEEEEE